MEHNSIIATLEKFSNKDISFNCVRDMVLSGFDLHPFDPEDGRKIVNFVDQKWRRDENYIHPQKYYALCNVVLEENYNWEALVELRYASFWPEQQLIDYREFWGTNRGSFHVLITDSFEDGRSIMRQLSTTDTDYIYVDTENSFRVLPHGGNLALLTFCDVPTRTILLWRVHKMVRSELNEVKKVVNDVGKRRRYASFGTERFFGRVQNVQYKRPDGGLISLKEAVWQNCRLNINKGETMSDWTKEVLSKDQIVYAGMDALAVRYVLKGERLDLTDFRPNI